MLIVKIRCFYWAMIGKLLNNPQFANTRLMHFLHLSFYVMLFRHMISKQSTFKLQNLFYHNQTAYCTVISAFIIFFSRYANVIFAIWQKWIIMIFMKPSIQWNFACCFFNFVRKYIRWIIFDIDEIFLIAKYMENRGVSTIKCH